MLVPSAGAGGRLNIQIASGLRKIRRFRRRAVQGHVFATAVTPCGAFEGGDPSKSWPLHARNGEKCADAGRRAVRGGVGWDAHLSG